MHSGFIYLWCRWLAGLLRQGVAVALGLVLWALCLAALAAPAAVTLQRVEGGTPLRGSVGFLVDADGRLGIDDVRMHRGPDPFAYPTTDVAREADARPVWFVVRLHQTQVYGDWVLSLASTGIQDLRFYGPYDAGGRALAEPALAGSLQPYGARQLANEQQAMRMQLTAPGDYTVYVRAVAMTSRVFGFSVSDMADFEEASQGKRLFDGITYGILLGMLVYNLVLLLVFRDGTYALYVLTGSMALLTIAGFNQHVARYLLPGWPVLADRLNVVLPALWICTGALFAYRFLELKRYAPLIGRLVLAMAVAALCTVVVGALGYQTRAQALNEHVSLVITLVVAIGAVRAWVQGFTPARLYLVGQLALFISVFLVVLSNWGYVDWPFVATNGLQIGATLEVMIFAVALGSRIRLMQAVQTDLTRKTANLTIAAETDPLTGVANRAGLAVQALAVLQQPYERTLMLLDLDRFKPINDEYGHDAGDAVLVEIARRIKAELRSDDTVARIGGDEFVVLLNQAHPRKVLEQISARLLHVISQPVEFGGKQLSVGSSVGVARFPGNGVTLAELMQAADVAMYHIKKHGRANYAFYEDLSGPDIHAAAESAGTGKSPA